LICSRTGAEDWGGATTTDSECRVEWRQPMWL
jgi:hypothetical protein